ncbi:MAG TPA: CopD family protein [Flavobacteriales bacterium]|nr:CopD family protein [Flavobacteriales bacterium]
MALETYDIYTVIKSLHIVFVVTWFAGLFYIVRLYVNHTEALQKPEPDKTILVTQYKKMERPLWIGITYPSMILTVTFGSIMLYMRPDLLYASYMHLKLTMVALLLVYHFYCGWLFKKYRNDDAVCSSFTLRILNEVASVFLVGIVFIIEMADHLNFLYFGIAMGAFCLLLLFVIIKFWNARKKAEKNQ